MFLRDDPKRMEAEFSYVLNLGLNTIRSEGKLENEHFYDLADSHGVMILAGWECCDKWESAARTGGKPWDAADLKVAEASMASEARLLRNHPAVWGYNIWNDVFAKTAPGRKRDINSVREWDPTHPAFCGTYRTVGMNLLTNADIMGYYDFHWKRGTDQHFSNLLAYANWSRERDAWFCTWLSATSGEPGKGNFNRSLYSANTGIASDDTYSGCA